MSAGKVFGVVIMTGALVFALHRGLQHRSIEEVDGPEPIERSPTPENGAVSPRDTVPEGHAAEGSSAIVSEAAPPGADSGEETAEDSKQVEAIGSVADAVLLKEVRDAGFVCYDLLAVESAAQNTSAWTVVCEAMRYFVTYQGADRFKVEPIPAFDYGPLPIQPPRDDGGGGIRVIPLPEVEPFVPPPD